MNNNTAAISMHSDDLVITAQTGRRVFYESDQLRQSRILALTMLYETAGDIGPDVADRMAEWTASSKPLTSSQQEVVNNWRSAHQWLNAPSYPGLVSFDACSVFFEGEMEERYGITLDTDDVREALLVKPREMRRLISIMIRENGGWS